MCESYKINKHFKGMNFSQINDKFLIMEGRDSTVVPRKTNENKITST